MMEFTPSRLCLQAPSNGKASLLRKNGKILIQSQMVISTTEWILPGCIPHLHDPIASFKSEFGEKLALLGPIELSRLFPNLHKIIIH